MSDHAKQVLDGASIVTAIGTIAGLLPNIAALFTIFWLGMQIVINWDKFCEKVRGAWKWMTSKSS